MKIEQGSRIEGKSDYQRCEKSVLRSTTSFGKGEKCEIQNLSKNTHVCDCACRPVTDFSGDGSS